MFTDVLVDRTAVVVMALADIAEEVDLAAGGLYHSLARRTAVEGQPWPIGASESAMARQLMRPKDARSVAGRARAVAPSTSPVDLELPAASGLRTPGEAPGTSGMLGMEPAQGPAPPGPALSSHPLVRTLLARDTRRVAVPDKEAAQGRAAVRGRCLLPIQEAAPPQPWDRPRGRRDMCDGSPTSTTV